MDGLLDFDHIHCGSSIRRHPDLEPRLLPLPCLLRRRRALRPLIQPHETIALDVIRGWGALHAAGAVALVCCYARDLLVAVAH